MIICEKCKTKNEPDAKTCTQCGKDLLPGENIQDRIGNVVVGILGGVISGLIAYFLIAHPDITKSSQICLLTNPAAWLFAAFAVPISSIALALRKTPEYIKYENRAKRHVDAEPEQAVADYGKALALSPEKDRARLLAARADLYKKLGRDEEATRDRLAYTYQEGAFTGQAGLARVLGADKDAFISSAINNERKKLVKEGKIIALGFCATCGKVVELTQQFLCPEHDSPKPKDIRFVMPEEVIAIKEKIEKEIKQESIKSKRSKTLILALIGIFIFLCIVIPLIFAVLQK